MSLGSSFLPPCIRLIRAAACVTVSVLIAASVFTVTATAPKALLAQAVGTSAEAGSLSGVVEDPSGARVPGCDVTIRDAAGAMVASMKSDASGSYQQLFLPAGRYAVLFAQPGFTQRRIELEIKAGNAARLDAHLEIGEISEVLTVTAARAAAVVAPAADTAPKPGPLTVGGRVENARLLVRPELVYPAELRQQGIEGTVKIRAIVSRDGVPQHMQVLNSDQVDSRFAQAALDAVGNWRYQPAMLNGTPVPVLTSIDVHFQLSQ